MTMGTSYLEPEFSEPYEAWKSSPGPETNASMLTALSPTIEGAIRTHVGEPNPLLLSRGRLLALQGLKSYDPARGRLTTHVYNQLQGLKRINRQQTSILKVPERVAIDRFSLDTAEKELRHTLGREPSEDELADYTGFSSKRMARVRSCQPGIAQGTLEQGGASTYGGIASPIEDRNRTWRDLVYSELDPYHQKVMEYTLGLHGRRPLSNAALAVKLGRSPGAISQAKLRIQSVMDEADALAAGGL